MKIQTPSIFQTLHNEDRFIQIMSCLTDHVFKVFSVFMIFGIDQSPAELARTKIMRITVENYMSSVIKAFG